MANVWGAEGVFLMKLDKSNKYKHHRVVAENNSRNGNKGDGRYFYFLAFSNRNRNDRADKGRDGENGRNRKRKGNAYSCLLKISRSSQYNTVYNQACYNKQAY